MEYNTLSSSVQICSPFPQTFFLSHNLVWWVLYDVGCGHHFIISRTVNNGLSLAYL